MSGDLLDLIEPPAPARVTERDMLDALALRYGKSHGNGPRYAWAEHVRSAAGFDAPRCADLIAIDLWSSSGNALHGHEVKVSRSDWLRELADPTKAEAFTPYMDHWWLVVPDAAIVRPGELPEGWGLMVAQPGVGARIVRRAPRLDAEPMPREMQATFARAIAKTADRMARGGTVSGDGSDTWRADEAPTLRAAADAIERLATDLYPEDVFPAPTRADLDAVNILLRHERGHGLDGIAALCYRRAMRNAARMLRETADETEEAHKP